MQLEPFDVKDGGCKRFWIALAPDMATGYVTAVLLHQCIPGGLWKSYQKRWFLWAGPPEHLIAAGQGRLVAEGFVERFCKYGTVLPPIAAHVRWQRREIERTVQVMRYILSGIIKRCGTTGASETHEAAHFAASAINRGPGGCS